MQIVRFKEKTSEEILYGSLREGSIFKINGDIYQDNYDLEDTKSFPSEEVELLTPITPSKIVALAINYSGATGQTKTMSEPLVFIKGSNTIVGNNKRVRIPFESDTWGESELGAVIKKSTLKDITKKNVKDYILGYISANDVSCNNVDERDHHLARSKSADGFCPVGDYIDTNYDFRNKTIQAYHNDDLIREGNTDQMIWNPEKIIIWLASWMTLNSGDLVMTGTPSRVRDRLFLSDGDTYTVCIQGLPDLKNIFYA